MGHLGVGNAIVVYPSHLAAQTLDGGAGGVNLSIAVHPFHGQEVPPHLHQRKAKLAEQSQVGYGPGGGKVKAFSEIGGLSGLFRPLVQHLQTGELPQEG